MVLTLVEPAPLVTKCGIPTIWNENTSARSNVPRHTGGFRIVPWMLGRVLPSYRFNFEFISAAILPPLSAI
jgi:hypothetical protein